MKIVHVAVGVVIDEASRVLVSLRAKQAHQGGLWEFPGGKCEPGETIQESLRRELEEELGIKVLRDAPLCKVMHDYGDKKVLLEVMRVLEFAGTPQGREGQLVRWAPISELDSAHFPAANSPIIRRIQLADRIAITGHALSNASFTAHFERMLNKSPAHIHFRQHGLQDQDFRWRAQMALAQCRERGILLTLNTNPEQFRALGGDALHVSSAILRQLTKRPVAPQIPFSASCHSLEELRLAEGLGADYALLSPIALTSSHPQQQPMGWTQCAQLIGAVSLPIYALGGMKISDIPEAQAHGAVGIASISAFWNAPHSE